MAATKKMSKERAAAEALMCACIERLGAQSPAAMLACDTYLAHDFWSGYAHWYYLSIDATLSDPVASKCYRKYCRSKFGNAWLPRIHAEISRLLSNTALFDTTGWHGIKEVAVVRTVMAAFHDTFLDNISMTTPAIDAIVDQIVRLLDALDDHAMRLLAETMGAADEHSVDRELTKCADTIGGIRAQLVAMQNVVHKMMAADFDHFIHADGGVDEVCVTTATQHGVSRVFAHYCCCQ